MSFVPLSRSQLAFIAEEFWAGGGENGDGRDLYGVAKHEGVWRAETTDADLIAEALHPSDADYYDRHRVDEMNDEEFEKWLAEDDADENDTISVDGQPLDEFLADSGDDPYRESDRQPRDEYGDLPDGDDGPDTLEVVIARSERSIQLQRELAMAELQAEYRETQRRRWNEDELLERVDSKSDRTTPVGPGVAAALERFTQDGITKIGMRYGIGEFGRYRDIRRHERPQSSIRPLTYDFESDQIVPSNPRWNGRRRFDTWKRHREAQYRTRQISPRITDPAYRDAA